MNVINKMSKNQILNSMVKLAKLHSKILTKLATSDLARSEYDKAVKVLNAIAEMNWAYEEDEETIAGGLREDALKKMLNEDLATYNQSPNTDQDLREMIQKLSNKASLLLILSSRVKPLEGDYAHDTLKNLAKRMMNFLSEAKRQLETNDYVDIATSQTTKIPEPVQELLGRINTIEGIGLPLKVDGILGENTRKALKAFNEKFMSGQASDRELFSKIIEMGKDPKYSL